MSNVKTVVQDVSFENLDDLFGTSDSAVMTVDEDEKKNKSVLTDKAAEQKEFIDNTLTLESKDTPPEGVIETPEEIAAKAAEAEKSEEVIEKPLVRKEELDTMLSPDAEVDAAAAAEADEKDKGGRPTVMEAVAKELFEKKLIKPFDGEEDFSKYTQKDFIELFEMNAENNKSSTQKEVEDQFFDSLSPRLKQAYHYIAQGGQDEVALFQALAASEQTRQLDISTEDGQEEAVRQYYQAIQFGDSQEIQKEINSLKDRGELAEKATRFKPKLDQMEESVVQQKLQVQEESNKKKHIQMQTYMDSVHTVLDKAEINGLPLDHNVQNMLYDGLVNPKYPSITGKATNMLGALLEKYQWVEPNHELVAEVLYLLADPNGYRTAVRSLSDKETVEKTVRMLKTEESSSKAGASSQAEESDTATHQRQGIKRKQNDFFKRKQK